MPISPIVLQRRHAELGRIRLGDQQATASGKTRPNKLTKFRFTSVSERYVRDLAQLYGGEAQAWDNNGVPSWEVYSTATQIPVIAVKGGLTQWMETWSGGGCVHRCDGITNQLTGEACDPEDPQHVDAKPTTRLSVMLPELEAIGVWRMESHGWNSAAEIPAVAELATFVGDLVPAFLHLVERRAIKDGKTSRFVVPVLDLQIGTARLRQIVEAKVAGGELPPAATAHVESTERKQLEGGRRDFVGEAESATSLDEVRETWKAASAAGAGKEVLDRIRIIGDGIAAGVQAGLAPSETPQSTSPDEVDGEVVDAEIVDAGSDDADAIWMRILDVTGKNGWDLSQTLDGYSEFSGGLIADDATGPELKAYLDHLTSSEQVSA